MQTVSRRKALVTLGLAAATMASGGSRAVGAESPARWWTPTPGMDAMTAIRTRRSVRSYTEQAVSDALVAEILGAAMAAPSAGNEQPWEFVVIRDKATLGRVGAINPYAGFAPSAPVAVLTCGNLQRDKFGGYWIEDVSAATQNLLLAAHALGLGAVWTGIYPIESRIRGFRALVGLPEHVVPMALVIMGYPKTVPGPENRFDASRIHAERWSG